MSTLWAAVAQPLMQELWRKSAQMLWRLALSMCDWYPPFFRTLLSLSGPSHCFLASSNCLIQCAVGG